MILKPGVVELMLLLLIFSHRFQIILLIIEEKMKRQIHSFTHTLIQNVQSQENIHY